MSVNIYPTTTIEMRYFSSFTDGPDPYKFHWKLQRQDGWYSFCLVTDEDREPVVSVDGAQLWGRDLAWEEAIKMMEARITELMTPPDLPRKMRGIIKRPVIYAEFVDDKIMASKLELWPVGSTVLVDKSEWTRAAHNHSQLTVDAGRGPGTYFWLYAGDIEPVASS